MYEVQPIHSKLLFKLDRHTDFTEGCVICCNSILCCSTILQVEITHIALLLKIGLFFFGAGGLHIPSEIIFLHSEFSEGLGEGICSIFFSVSSTVQIKL